MRRLAFLTVSLAIVLLVMPAPAQVLRPDPGPEEPRTAQMMHKPKS